MNYDRIYPCCFVNGPGCRVVLFVTGCLHKCEGCYNRSTLNARNGQLFTMNTVKELASHLSKSYIQGLTLTGGDPLYPQNREEISNLVSWVKARFPEKDIWLWTGYKFEDIKQLEMLKYVDEYLQTYISIFKHFKLFNIFKLISCPQPNVFLRK